MAQTLTTTGPADSIKVDGGRYFFNVFGSNWGGTSISLEWSDDNVNFSVLKDLNGSDVALTDSHNFAFTVSRGWVRPNATGGTDIDLNWSIGEI
jgi:hypothetical protein